MAEKYLENKERKWLLCHDTELIDLLRKVFLFKRIVEKNIFFFKN